MKSLTKKILTFVFSAIASVVMAVGVAFFATDGFKSASINAAPVSVEQTSNENLTSDPETNEPEVDNSEASKPEENDPEAEEPKLEGDDLNTSTEEPDGSNTDSSNGSEGEGSGVDGSDPNVEGKEPDTEDKDPDDGEYGATGTLSVTYHYYDSSLNKATTVKVNASFTINYNVEQFVYCSMPYTVKAYIRAGLSLYGYTSSSTSTGVSWQASAGRVGTNVGRGSGSPTMELYAVYCGNNTVFDLTSQSVTCTVRYAQSSGVYSTSVSTTSYEAPRYKGYYIGSNVYYGYSSYSSWNSSTIPSGAQSGYLVGLTQSIPNINSTTCIGYSLNSTSYTADYVPVTLSIPGINTSLLNLSQTGNSAYYIYAVYSGEFGDFNTTGISSVENFTRTYYYWGTSGTTSFTGTYNYYAYRVYTSGTWNYNFTSHSSGVTSSERKSLMYNSSYSPPKPSSANGCSFKGWSTSYTATSATDSIEFSSERYLYAVYYGVYNRSVSGSSTIYFYYATSQGSSTTTSKSTTYTTNYRTASAAYFNYNFTRSTGTITSSTTYSSIYAPSIYNITIDGVTATAVGFSTSTTGYTVSVSGGAYFTPVQTAYYAKYKIEYGALCKVPTHVSKTVNYNWGNGNGSVSSATVDTMTFECNSNYMSWYDYRGSYLQDVGKVITYSFHSDGITLPTQSDAKYLFAKLTGWRLGSTSGTLYSAGGTYGKIASDDNASSSTTPYTGTVTFYAVWSSSSPTSSSATTTVSVTNTSFTYDGYSHKPTVSVKFNGSTLSSSYYTLTYYTSSGTSTSSPISVGTYKVRVSGTTSYPAYDYYEYSFTISKDTITSVDLTINGSTSKYTNGDTKRVVYTGSSKYPSVVRVYGRNYGSFTSSTLGYTVSPSSSNSNFTNVGTVTYTVSGSNNFTGSISISIVIYRISITDYSFQLNQYSYVYNGSYKTPSVSHASLVENTDYTVSYSNNLNAGNASVIITGINSYCDTKTISFTIEKAPFYSVVASIKEGTTTKTATSTTSSTGTLTITYQAKEMLPSYSITTSNSVSVPSSYYSVTYTRSGATGAAAYTDAGTTTITVSAKANGTLNNFSGSLSITYVINKKYISDSDVDITLSSYYYYYTGGTKTPTVTAKYNGVTLTKINSSTQNTSYDYRYTYSSNKNAGTAYVNIYANNVNYAGSTSVSFTIYKATLSTAYYYKQSTGTSKTYSVTSGGSLSEVYSRASDAFTLARVVTTSSSNIEADISSEIKEVYKRGNTTTTDLKTHGTITATISSASNNFDGSITFTLIINQRSLSTYYSSSFRISPTTYTYDGSYKKPTVYCDDNLVEGVDYSYEYYNNRNASSNARVVISAVSGSDFCDSVTKYFTINPATLTSVDVKIDSTTYTFKGTNNSKTLTYKRAEYALAVTGVYDESGARFTDNGSFYNVSFTRNNSVTTDFKTHGDIVIKIDTTANSSGVRNYVGSFAVTITINRLSITGYKDYFSLEYYRTFYNYGAQLKPAVTVNDPIKDITSSEYSVSYSNNINSTKGYTQAMVTITGEDNYNGSFILYFDIDPIELDTSRTEFVGADSNVKYYSSSGLFEVTYDKGYHKIIISSSSFSCDLPRLDYDLRDSTFGLTVSYKVTYSKTNSTVGENSCRNVGDYVFVVTFTPRDSRNFYTDPTTKTATMRINPKSLQASDLGVSNFIITPSSYVYDSFAKTPTVTSRDTDIVEGNGFVIDKYADNINASKEAKIYIHGINNYTDSLILYFEITKAPLGDVKITIENYGFNWNTFYNLVYTRYPFEPVFVVYTTKGRDNSDIVPTSEYTITSKRNDGSGRPDNDYTNVGTVTFTFTAKSNSVNFKGSTTAIIEIVPRQLSQEEVTVLVTSTHLYDGTPQNPTFVVTWRGTDLVPYSSTNSQFYDFTYSVSNNINAGDRAKIDITLHGNYSGTLEGYFSIYKRMVSLSGITFENAIIDYDREAHFIYVNGVPPTISDPFETEVLVTYTIYKLGSDNSRELVAEGVHSLDDCKSVVDVGEYIFVATISLSNQNLYLDVDTYEASLTINNVILNMDYFSLAETAYTYDGQVHKPEVLCSLSFLEQGVDYVVYYTKSPSSKDEVAPVDVATYYVIIEGYRNYYGNTVLSYRINKAKLSYVKLEVRGNTYDANPSFVFDGASYRPVFHVFDANDLEITNLGASLRISELTGDGSSVTYTNVGTTTITITALSTSNWSGTLTASLTITPLFVNVEEYGDDGFIMDVTSTHVYNEQEQVPSLFVKYHGIELKLGSDYRITNLLDNIDAGSYAMVEITFINNYSGTASKYFEIEQVGLSKVVIEIDGNYYDNTVSVEFSGEKIEPHFTVYAGENKNILVDSMYYTFTNPEIVGTGTYEVTFTVSTYQNFKGEITATIVVTGKDVSGEVEKGTFSFILEKDVFVYSGSSYTPVPICIGEDTEEVTFDYYYAKQQGEGYERLIAPIEVGTYYVIVYGTGNYSGEFKLEFNIVPISISYFRMAVNPSDPNNVREYLGYNVNASREYTASAFSLYFRVYDSNTFVIDEKNYKIEYYRGDTLMQADELDLTSVGEITIVISALSDTEFVQNYTGSITAKFTITKVNSSSSGNTLEFSINEDSFVFNKQPHKPGVSLKFNGEPLAEEDFEVKYVALNGMEDDCINVGTYRVVVTLKGNFEGTLQKDYRITPAQIDRLQVSIEGASGNNSSNVSVVFTGSLIEPTYVLFAGSLEVESGLFTVQSDELLNVGVYKLIAVLTDAEGAANYELGNVTATVTITAKTVEEGDLEIEAINDTFTYDGTPKYATYKITFNGAEVPHSYSYSNNVNANEGATATITFSGNFSGQCTKQFTINPAQLHELEMSIDDLVSVNGEITAPWVGDNLYVSFKVYDSSRNLVNSGYYTITVKKDGSEYPYQNGLVEGTYLVEVTSKDDLGHTNYTGTLNGTIRVERDVENLPSINNDEELSYEYQAVWTYTGEQITPSVAISKTSGEAIGSENYELRYENNVNAGTGTIIIVGKNAYKGSKSLEFTINRRQIDLSSVGFTTDRFVFDGTLKTLDLINLPSHLNLPYSQIYSYSVSVTDREGQSFSDVGVYEFVFDFEIVNNNYQFGNGDEIVITYQMKHDLTITALNIEGSGEISFSLSFTSAVYNGKANVPNILVRASGKYSEVNVTYNSHVEQLVGEEYQLLSGEVIDAGKYRIVIESYGNFSGTVRLEFEITKAIISFNSLKFSSDRRQYSGQNQTLEYSGLPESIGDLSLDDIYTATLTVKFGEQEWLLDNCIDVGTYTFTLSFKLNEENEKSKNFTLSEESRTATLEIYKFELNEGDDSRFEISVEIEGKVYVYDGTAHTPTITIYELVYGSDGDRTKKLLVRQIEGQPADADYTLEYSNNTNAGTATVTITLIKNYSGTIIKTFEIQRAVIDTRNVVFASLQTEYSGKAYTIEPSQIPTTSTNELNIQDILKYSVSITHNGTVWTENCVEIGTYIFTLSFELDSANPKSSNFSISQSTKTATLEISSKKIEEGDSSIEVLVDGGTFAYNGSQITPNVTVNEVIAGEHRPLSESDYRVEYQNNINAGIASVIVTLLGNYEGTKTATFTISEATLSSVTINVNGVSAKDVFTATYSGEVLTPSFTVKDASENVVLSDNYTISYDSEDVPTFVDAKDYKIYFTAKQNSEGHKNYSGSITATITINPLKVDDPEIEDEISVTVTSTHVYDGNVQDPTLVVMYNRVVLERGLDYVVSYDSDKNRIDAGTYNIYITFQGNYSGSYTTQFTIEQAVLDLSKVQFNNATFVYDGEQKRIEPSNLPSAELCSVETKAYLNGAEQEECINVGTYNFVATFTITNSNYKFKNGRDVQTMTANLIIKPVGLDVGGEGSRFEYKLSKDNFIYDGTAKQPSVTVKFNSRTLTEQVDGVGDYMVKYNNNVNAGQASVTITGLENFEGGKEIVLYYTISRAQLVRVETFYNGESYDPQNAFTFFGEDLKTHLTFTVYADADDGTQVVLLENLTRTDSAISFTDVGTYTVTFAAKAGEIASNYSGSQSVQISIVAVDSEKTPENKQFTVEVGGDTLYYNGEVQRPEIVVSYGSNENWIVLVEGRDFDIEYSDDGIIAGKHTFNIVLKGNYTGTLNGEYTIYKAVIDLTNLSFDSNELSVTFDGNKHTLSISGIPEGLDETFIYTLNVRNKEGYEFVDVGDYIFVYTFSIIDEQNYEFHDHSVKFTKQETLSIVKLNIDVGTESGVLEFSLSSYSFVYNGQVHKPNVLGRFGDVTLVEGQDFKVEISGKDRGLINAGEYTVKITGQGNYDKYIELTYEIQKASISGLKIVLGKVTSTENSLMVAYTGAVIEFSVKVLAGSVDVSGFCDLSFMRDGIDVTAHMEDISTYGIGTINIIATARADSEEFTNNYTGTANGELIIVQKAINGGAYKFSLEQDVFTYTGESFEPAVLVECDDSAEAERVKKSIHITYRDNINAGTATVEIVGYEMYTGGVYLTFIIKPASLVNAHVKYKENESTANSLDIVYVGSDISADVSALVYARGVGDSLILIDANNYELVFANNMIDVGSKTILVRAAYNSEVGAKNYEGELYLYININGKSINDAKYNFRLNEGETSFLYDGLEKCPNVLCETLVQDSDFTIQYIGNVDVGQAQVKINGTNNYTGEIILDFEILPVQLSKLTVMVDGVYSTGSILTTEYTGSVIYPTLIVLDSQQNQVKLEELNIVWDEILSVKSYNIVLSSKTNSKGNQNYTGVLYGGVIVTQGLLKSYEFELQETEYVYSGDAYCPDVNYIGRLVDFEQDRDYVIKYYDNIDAGTARAVVVGVGNYTGEVVLTYSISQLLVNVIGDVQFSDKIITFNGDAQQIDLVLPEGLPTAINAIYQAWHMTYDSFGNEIIGDEIDYRNCVNVGYYKFKVFLSPEDSNYVLDVTEYEAVLTIIRAKINESMFTLNFEGDDLVYNGLAHCPTVVPNKDFITFNAQYGNNIDAGLAYIILTGIGNYENAVRLTFMISQARIDLSEAVWENDSFVYDTTEKVVRLTNLPDYILNAIIYGGEYSAVDAGVYRATASIEINNNYILIGEISELVWEIEKADVDTSEIVVAQDTVVTYDGRPHVVDVSNYDSNKIIIRYEFKNELGNDVPYCDHAGRYSVRVIFVPTANYKLARGAVESVETSLTIVSRNFENGLGPFIIEEIPNQEYTGEAIIPPVIVRNSDTLEILTEGVDYELQFLNNISIGTAIVIVIGMGNYSGEISTTFRIVGSAASNQNNTNNGEVSVKEVGIIIAIFVALIVVFVVTIVIIVYSFTKKSKKKDDDFLQ